jgi:hypothetical protein
MWADGDLCQANGPVPGRFQDYDVNNCQLSGLASVQLGIYFDVFKCVKRKCYIDILVNALIAQ